MGKEADIPLSQVFFTNRDTQQQQPSSVSELTGLRKGSFLVYDSKDLLSSWSHYLNKVIEVIAVD